MEQQYDGVEPGSPEEDTGPLRSALEAADCRVGRFATGRLITRLSGLPAVDQPPTQAESAPSIRRSIAAAEGPTGPRGDMYTSFGQGFSRAFELAVTPTLFGAMGYGLDRWLGTLPVFTAIFSLVALVAMLLRTWFGYCHRMEALEAQGPWARHRPASQPPGTGPEVAR